MHFRDLIPILPQLFHQLRRIELTVASSRLDHLALLLQGEVRPLKVRPYVFLEEREHLVVADGARVGEVVDTHVVMLGEQEGGGEEVGEDGVGVWDVDDFGVFCDLGDEGAGVEVVGDGHAETEDEGVWVGFEELDLDWMGFSGHDVRGRGACGVNR